MIVIEIITIPTRSFRSLNSKHGRKSADLLCRSLMPSPRQRRFHEGTGEGGIRTLGSLLGYGALAKRCFQPLSHLTKIVATACGPLRDAPQARGCRGKQRISLRIADCQHRPASCARDFIGVANCRLLIEMMAMISEEEARTKIIETVRPLPVRRLPISKSLGCFAGEDHFARLPLPAFDNSA